MPQRTRKEILGHIDEAVKSPSHSPGEEQRRIDLAVLECLLDIRDGTTGSMCTGLPGGTGPHNFVSVYAQEKNHTSLFCQYCGVSREL